MNSKCEDAQTQGIDLDISSEKDFAIRPASKKYQFFIKLIEKNIDFERGGERQADPASGREQKSIDFSITSIGKNIVLERRGDSRERTRSEKYRFYLNSLRKVSVLLKCSNTVLHFQHRTSSKCRTVCKLFAKN